MHKLGFAPVDSGLLLALLLHPWFTGAAHAQGQRAASATENAAPTQTVVAPAPSSASNPGAAPPPPANVATPVPPPQAYPQPQAYPPQPYPPTQYPQQPGYSAQYYPGQPGYPPLQQGYPPPQYTPLAQAQVASPQSNPYLRAGTPGELAEEHFGRRGQLVVTEDFNISYYSNNGTSNLNVRPSLDYFFTDRLSIGGRLGLSWYSSNGNSNQSRSIAWRFGANFGLGEKVSIWLTLENGIVLPENSSNLLFTNLVFPVLLHPAPHFFVGIGPYLDGQRTLGESESDVDFGGGLTSFVGGWW